jgi:hypothetical protein
MKFGLCDHPAFHIPSDDLHIPVLFTSLSFPSSILHISSDALHISSNALHIPSDALHISSDALHIPYALHINLVLHYHIKKLYPSFFQYLTHRQTR